MNKTAIEWTDYDLGWISALIDGEGSISLIKERRPKFRDGATYKPRLNIANKCRKLLEKAQGVVGAGAIIPRKKDLVLNLDISANGARTILPHLHLIVKEKQRILLLEALDILESRKGGRGQPGPALEGTERLLEIYQEIRELNGK
jgi:hypothetical protein